MVLTEVEKKHRKHIANQKYIKNNKQKVLNWNRNWAKTNPYKNHKSKTLFSWRKAGIIDTDYSALYEFVIKETNCWICGKEFGKDRTLMNHRSLDHDHDTGEARLVCCTACNLFILRDD